MLVLSRKLGEKIFIGENICITVVDIDRGKIRLGIEAPREVSVVRAELVPERQTRSHRSTNQAHISPNRPDVRCPPFEARGNDSRRRGRFR